MCQKNRLFSSIVISKAFVIMLLIVGDVFAEARPDGSYPIPEPCVDSTDVGLCLVASFSSHSSFDCNEAIERGRGGNTNFDLMCLACNVYFEARNEQSFDSQMGVTEVTGTRRASSSFPDSFCGVIAQPLQFSWLNGDGPHTVNLRIEAERLAWQRAVVAAALYLNNFHSFPATEPGGRPDFISTAPSRTECADHYHAEYVTPEWAALMNLTTQIESHHFFRDSRRSCPFRSVDFLTGSAESGDMAILTIDEARKAATGQSPRGAGDLSY